MEQRRIFHKMDDFLARKLSSSVFTWREILDLIVPSVLDSISVMFINMLITALISKNGEASISAVALVGPVAGLILCVFNGIGAGGTVVVAQCKGRQDPELLKQAIGVILRMTVLVGVAACIPFLLFPRQILLALFPAAEEIVLEKAVIFLSGSVWSILVFTVYTAAFSVLRGLGESKKCLALSVIINVAYLLLSILFLNFLNMDIQGSVLALFLARLIGAAAAVALLLVIRPPVPMTLRYLAASNHALARSTMTVGIPLGLEQLFANLSGLVSQMYMIPLGTTALAIHAIANSLIGLLYAPASSLNNVSVAVVGRCVGAGKESEAYTYGKRCRQISLLLLILTSVIFYPLLPILLRQYNPTAEIASTSTRLLLYSLPCLLLFYPASFVTPNTLRAGSDTVYPSVVSLGVLWVVNTALGYFLAIPMGLGLLGVWAAIWASWAVRAGLFQLRFRSRKWLTKSVLASGSPSA